MEKIDTTKIPEGIWIIAVIMFSISYIAFISAFQAFIWTETSPEINTLVYFGLSFMVFSLAAYMIGKGLLALENRARLTTMGLLAVAVLFTIYSTINRVQVYASIFAAALSIVAIWYLTKPETKNLFNAKKV